MNTLDTQELYIDRNELVVLLTSSYRVIGNLYLVAGRRLTDVVSLSEQFIALTDATVWNKETGRMLFKASFIDIDKNEIEIIVPADRIETTGDDVGCLGAWVREHFTKKTV